MKRSEINNYLRRAEEVVALHNFKLPPFAYWTPQDWANIGTDCDEIRDNMLGWDVAALASEESTEGTLVFFTIRNGNQHDEKYTKTYAEKIMIIDEGQTCPLHFHWSKMEDIINRGGGNMLMKLYNSTPDGELADTDVTVSVDGRKLTVEAGGVIRLLPGESVTLPVGMYHSFWAEDGLGTVFAGEVSQCNDDKTDNRFYIPRARFPVVEEDEPPYRYLCTEYPTK